MLHISHSPSSELLGYCRVSLRDGCLLRLVYNDKLAERDFGMPSRRAVVSHLMSPTKARSRSRPASALALEAQHTMP